MKPLIERITKEPVTVDLGYLNLPLKPMWIEGSFDGDPEAEANAEFIAEAFAVTHETGMTPRELADALASARSAIEESTEQI